MWNKYTCTLYVQIEQIYVYPICANRTNRHTYKTMATRKYEKSAKRIKQYSVNLCIVTSRFVVISVFRLIPFKHNERLKRYYYILLLLHVFKSDAKQLSSNCSAIVYLSVTSNHPKN